jgi:cation/acetate symporter
VIILGIFDKRMNKEGAITGMILGMGFTMFYIIGNRFFDMDPWFFDISAEGIGTVGAVINFAACLIVSRLTPAPPADIQEMVESVRIPRGSGAAIEHY